MRHAASKVIIYCSSPKPLRSSGGLPANLRPTLAFRSIYCIARQYRHSMSSVNVRHDLGTEPCDMNDSDIRTNPPTQAEPQSDAGRPTQAEGGKPLSKKRDTHFLCFPLVTDTSIPQLAASLRQFRETSTRAHTRKTRQDVSDQDSTGALQTNSGSPTTQSAGYIPSELEPNTNHSLSLPSVSPDLQILPEIAHRPPGTFHLTLGVMDLSTKEEMDRALDLLEMLDYREIFDAVLSQRSERPSPLKQNQQDASRNQVVQDSSSTLETEAKLPSLQRPISPPSSKGTVSPNGKFGKDNPPLIDLTGLSTFPSAKSSRVFYAKPSPSLAAPFPLLQFGQAIRRKFREAGFITETRPLVLHATVANMRYATQARGGRTSKGKAWRYGKRRWDDGQVNATELIKCFDSHGGRIEEYVKGDAAGEEAQEYVWAEGIALNRVAICKMGAEKSDDEVLGMIYPPVGEKLIFS